MDDMRADSWMLIYRSSRLDAVDAGPGLHSTSPHSCNIVTRTHGMERECPGRSGMEYVDRLHGKMILEPRKPGHGCIDAWPTGVMADIDWIDNSVAVLQWKHPVSRSSLWRTWRLGTSWKPGWTAEQDSEPTVPNNDRQFTESKINAPIRQAWNINIAAILGHLANYETHHVIHFNTKSYYWLQHRSNCSYVTSYVTLIPIISVKLHQWIRHVSLLRGEHAESIHDHVMLHALVRWGNIQECEVGGGAKSLNYITLHYITLHYITLHYITLHYITLHCIALHYIALHCIALHCIALHCITLHYITLHYITSHHITLHYITLHYITLHYITLHYVISYANYTYSNQWYINKIFKFSECELNKMSFQKFFESISDCEFLERLNGR